MKKFLNQDFLLDGNISKKLYYEYAEREPIIDYHCHLSPQEIYEDVKYDNITQVWLRGDHYKWRIMRANGVDEQYITGNASDREKFQKWVETLSMAIGNPLYHWSHLELKNYFGYEGCLNTETAEEVWNLCKIKLKNMSARKMICMSNVKVICTTDDPVDSLIWHQKIIQDGFEVKVLPAWRPDKAINIEKHDYLNYLVKLEKAAGTQIHSYHELVAALQVRMDYFEKNGCTVSDHGLDYIMYEYASIDDVEAIFAKRLANHVLTKDEIRKFKTALLVTLGRSYAKRNWVMQLHYGAQRDLNTNIFAKLGPDSGGDAISNYTPAVEMGQFLNALTVTNELPKTILYSLNPNDNAIIDTVIGCFQDSSCIGKIQHGSAWWFNDNKAGMINHLTELANNGVLGNFVGMLTDSRSFLSYARHEYFRRILCNLIGKWIEEGEYPMDEKTLEKIIKGISYENAKSYFEF